MWKRIALMIGVLTAVMGAVLPIGPSAPKYVAAYHSPLGYFSEDYNYFLVPHVRVPLHAPAGAPPGNPNGVYRYDSSGFPAAGTYYNYWVDPIFNTNIGSLAAQVRQLTVSQEHLP